MVQIPVKEDETKRDVVEKRVREYFKGNATLIDIAWCESRFRQFDEDGGIHRGEINSRDVGVMQINERFHLDQALKLDYDVYSLEGNMAYAKYLFDKQGSNPWNSSRTCWKKLELARG